ncbi:E3 ubiquitin/ISG15 ligase TRIM25-like [Cheilinus undulatus]|uniref:E3 ubiquitin/ISG15 ligase TRIM25-like n=1 Tax=Cheilinus undulatus TaxID=241271 RepID=UPI001BD4DBC9|nr:E3 ubiquitin/ISG15 ligase TRIM25-like [Cheilinus undulatus]
MADVDQGQFSLMSLEDELTCSICLSTFDCPVTLPCGHNFCQDCLLSHWKDSYSCPQCRTLFPTKPELKKNTVLSTVVKTFNLESNKIEANQVVEESKDEKKEDVIRCDTCMEAEASKTCLTCMASFCEEHLQPHRENPKFSVHQLCEPEDMSERVCADHHKLIEFFCSEHGRPICSLCLQQVHKGCPFISPEEQRSQKESNFQEKLNLLDEKIERTEVVLLQMKDTQSKLKDASAKRKISLAGMYQQMRDLLAAEEREAQHEVDRELEMGQMKLQDFTKRFTENAEKMRKAKGDISSLLSQSQTLAFLKASYDLPRVVNFDPHPPRITLDSKKVTATQAFAAELKEYLTEILKQPVEARLLTLKPDEKAVPVSGSESSARAGPESDSSEQRNPPRSHSPGHPAIQPIYQPVPVPVYIHSPQAGWNPHQHAQSTGPHKGPPFKGGQKTNKKSDPGHKPFHKQDRPPSAQGGGKPTTKGSDSTKKDHQKSHPSSGKPTKGHPQPHKNK